MTNRPQPKALSLPYPLDSTYNLYLEQEQYAELIAACEEAIATDPTNVPSYWYLGLALLLTEQEEAAQLTWMAPLLEAESEQAEAWMQELIEILQAEAVRQEVNTNYEQAWLIRQHWFELAPGDLENQLHSLRLALQAQIFSFDQGLLAEITNTLRHSRLPDWTSSQLLLPISQQLLDVDPVHPETIQFVEAFAPHLSDKLCSQLVQLLLTKITACHQAKDFQATLLLCELVEQFAATDFTLLLKLVGILQHGDLDCLMESIALAERCLAMAANLGDRFAAVNALLSSWIYSGGNWQRSIKLYQDYKELLISLVQSGAKQQHETQKPLELYDPELGFIPALLAVGGMCFYFEDAPQQNRLLRNQVAQIAQSRLQAVLQPSVEKYQQRHNSLKLRRSHRLPKIGYFAGSLRQHSVGWLCRWLFKYHDPERMEVHLYSSRQSNDLIQNSFRQQYGDRFHDVPSAITEIADRIYDDQIDILVELDSLTSFGGCGVVALKPAPIQVHWLGYDASGVPGVDYFIADPYVLPENAQNCYSETIWRLPETYIAVDGFEIHTPSLRREDLGIPSNAVVYFSGQTGMKRNLEHIRLQFQILKHVPGSYFLVKSFNANPDFVEEFFQQVADEEGVSCDRLRFLPDVPSEFTHRANLGLVDIVLDTYPYNGATTTLETLWMGIPIVTRVGEQFAARNSYTMMRNAGITEGIAWSEQEYLEWGVRLGTDAALRQDIAYRLRQSRHTSPLWNGRQFAREMEKAYEQMWQRYWDDGER